MQDFCWTFAGFLRTPVTSVWILREQTPKDLTHWEQTTQGVAAAQQHQASPLQLRCAAVDTSLVTPSTWECFMSDGFQASLTAHWA